MADDLDLDAIEATAFPGGTIGGALGLALVAEVRRLRAIEAEVIDLRADFGAVVATQAHERAEALVVRSRLDAANEEISRLRAIENAARNLRAESLTPDNVGIAKLQALDDALEADRG